MLPTACQLNSTESTTEAGGCHRPPRELLHFSIFNSQFHTITQLPTSVILDQMMHALPHSTHCLDRAETNSISSQTFPMMFCSQYWYTDTCDLRSIRTAPNFTSRPRKPAATLCVCPVPCALSRQSSPASPSPVQSLLPVTSYGSCLAALPSQQLFVSMDICPLYPIVHDTTVQDIMQPSRYPCGSPSPSPFPAPAVRPPFLG